MMTREEVLTIEEYCAEHKIAPKQRLRELGLPIWTFYRSRDKYRKEDENNADPGVFIQLPSGKYVSQAMTPAKTSKTAPKLDKYPDSSKGSHLTIELQTRAGVAMRISGEMTPALLRELISAGNV